LLATSACSLGLDHALIGATDGGAPAREAGEAAEAGVDADAGRDSDASLDAAADSALPPLPPGQCAVDADCASTSGCVTSATCDP
jgi:hypothetical protein